MQPFGRRIFAPTLAALALTLVVGCSSSNKNNNNNNAANAVNQAANVAANRPATAAATVTVAPLRTATPLAIATRTPTPGALIAGRTATPASVPGLAPNTAPAESGLQSALTSAALGLGDLPAGYTTFGSADTSRPLPGETASYTQTFANLAIPNVGVIVDGLIGFSDANAAHAIFTNLQTTLQNLNASTSLKLTPVSNTTTIGDETQVYSATLTNQGLNFSGYLVAWRRGRLGGQIILAGSGTAAPSSPSDAIALAQKQDVNLQKVQQ